MSHFLSVHLVQTKIFEVHFHFRLHISVQVDCRPLSQQIFERTSSNSIRKRQDVMNILRTSWTWLIKTSPNICLMEKMENNIWRYLLHEGLVWQKSNFNFLSRPDLTVLHAKFQICQAPFRFFLQITSQIFDKIYETKYSFRNSDNFASPIGKNRF